jgi:hypothetical protein
MGPLPPVSRHDPLSQLVPVTGASNQMHGTGSQLTFAPVAEVLTRCLLKQARAPAAHLPITQGISRH